MATHYEQVKAMLRARRTVCATTFWAEHLPTARNRIGELRRKGWVIESKHRCQNSNHVHDTRQIEYRLISEPGAGQQSMGLG